MAFSPESEKLVNELIQAEYLNAVVNFGEKYNSLHEGYAVLLEEVEEVEHCIKQARDKLDYIWTCIKLNRTETVKCFIDSLNTSTKDATKELAQVGAVLMKFGNTLGGENEI